MERFGPRTTFGLGAVPALAAAVLFMVFLFPPLPRTRLLTRYGPGSGAPVTGAADYFRNSSTTGIAAFGLVTGRYRTKTSFISSAMWAPGVAVLIRISDASLRSWA